VTNRARPTSGWSFPALTTMPKAPRNSPTKNPGTLLGVPIIVRSCPITDKMLQCHECPLCANRDRCTAAKCYSMSDNSTHIHGTHVPVEEPSTASETDIPTRFITLSRVTRWGRCRRASAWGRRNDFVHLSPRRGERERPWRLLHRRVVIFAVVVFHRIGQLLLRLAVFAAQR
jgi:hypothetical protein